MPAVTHWLKRRWDANVEHVKLRPWQAVAHESNNEGLELPADDNDLVVPGYGGPCHSTPPWTAAEGTAAVEASPGAFGAIAPRSTGGVD
jgi:hypothetical protein